MKELVGELQSLIRAYNCYKKRPNEGNTNNLKNVGNRFKEDVRKAAQNPNMSIKECIFYVHDETTKKAR